MRTSGAGQSALLLLDVVELLDDEKVNYAVVGAMAASVHGVVRASFDADAVLMLTVQQAPELEKKLVLAGFNTQLRRGDSTDPIPALLSLTDAFRNRVDPARRPARAGGCRFFQSHRRALQGGSFARHRARRLHCHEGFCRRTAGSC